MLSAFRNDSVIFCKLEHGPEFFLCSSRDSCAINCFRIRHLLGYVAIKQNNLARHMHNSHSSSPFTRAKIELSKCTCFTKEFCSNTVAFPKPDRQIVSFPQEEGWSQSVLTSEAVLCENQSALLSTDLYHVFPLMISLGCALFKLTCDSSCSSAVFRACSGSGGSAPAFHF
jgi:hypothetical protein